jgi:hypothetical protein
MSSPTPFRWLVHLMMIEFAEGAWIELALQGDHPSGGENSFRSAPNRENQEDGSAGDVLKKSTAGHCHIPCTSVRQCGHFPPLILFVKTVNPRLEINNSLHL